LIIVAVVQHDLILSETADRFVTGHHLSLQNGFRLQTIETDTDSLWVAPLKVPLIGVHSLKLRPTESFT
jgi:hypothetical protein